MARGSPKSARKCLYPRRVPCCELVHLGRDPRELISCHSGDPHVLSEEASHALAELLEVGARRVRRIGIISRPASVLLATPHLAAALKLVRHRSGNLATSRSARRNCPERPRPRRKRRRTRLWVPIAPRKWVPIAPERFTVSFRLLHLVYICGPSILIIHNAFDNNNIIFL